VYAYDMGLWCRRMTVFVGSALVSHGDKGRKERVTTKETLTLT
jgi:hypothetical protein